MNFTISFIWIYNNEFIHIFGMRSGIIFLVFICFFSQFGAQFLIWLIGISQQQQSYLSLCDSNLYESQSLHVHIESKPARCNCEWIEKFSHSVCPMVIISETSLTDYLSFTCDVMMFIWYFFFLFLYLFLHVFFFCYSRTCVHCANILYEPAAAATSEEKKKKYICNEFSVLINWCTRWWNIYLVWFLNLYRDKKARATACVSYTCRFMFCEWMKVFN